MHEIPTLCNSETFKNYRRLGNNIACSYLESLEFTVKTKFTPHTTRVSFHGDGKGLPPQLSLTQQRKPQITAKQLLHNHSPDKPHLILGIVFFRLKLHGMIPVCSEFRGVFVEPSIKGTCLWWWVETTNPG